MAKSSVPVQAVLSKQVLASRYFFLEVVPTRRSGVFPAYGGREQCSPDFQVQRDSFQWCTLEWVTSGRGTVVLDGRAYPLEAGTLFRYDKRTVIEIRGDPAAPMEKYFLCLTGEDAAARLDAVGVRAADAALIQPLEEVRRAWEDLIGAGQGSGATTERLSAALMEVLLLRIEEYRRRGARTWSHEHEFRQAKEKIDQGAANLHRMAELTRLTGLSTTKLSRLFRRHEGVSPCHYLLRRKMHLAAEYFLTTSARVKEVSARLGFVDPYHFSRCFKRVHGVSPRPFRNARAGGSAGA